MRSVSLREESSWKTFALEGFAYVKSPVASLCFLCSSVRNRVSVTMSVLIFSRAKASASPLACAMVRCQCGEVYEKLNCEKDEESGALDLDERTAGCRLRGVDGGSRKECEWR